MQDLEATVLRRFPGLADYTFSIHTNSLVVSDGEPIEVDEESWGAARLHLEMVTIVRETPRERNERARSVFQARAGAEALAEAPPLLEREGKTRAPTPPREKHLVADVNRVTSALTSGPTP
jgi:hypothetical protein